MSNLCTLSRRPGPVVIFSARGTRCGTWRPPSSCRNWPIHNAHEQWLADGATDANTRGLERARSLLADYEPPSLDPRVDEAMLAFIKQRKSELPDNVT